MKVQAGGADYVRVDEVSDKKEGNDDDLHVYLLAKGDLLEALLLRKDVAADFLVRILVHVLIGLLDVKRDQ